MGNHLFVIFAVLDMSCAVNSCINQFFFTFISTIILNGTFMMVYAITDIKKD